MKRGMTPACRYRSTDDADRSVRRVMRRFGRLLGTPDLAFHEFDRVTCGIADVHGLSAERPRDLALDGNAMHAQLRNEVREPAFAHAEGDVARPTRPVRGDITPRLPAG